MPRRPIVVGAFVAALLTTAGAPSLTKAAASQDQETSERMATEGLPIPAPARPEPDCEGIPAPPALPLYLIGLYETSTLSSAWLGDPDEETHVVDIHVEPGPPLHLVIGHYGRIIFRFSGTTSRIGHLTLMARKAAGAVGIEANRIRFAPACLSHDSLRGRTSADVAGLVERIFPQRAVTAVAGAYEAQHIRIGRDIRIHEGVRPQLRSDPETNELYRFSPGGISRVDFRAVVSPVPVGPSRTLPQEAGVRQLVMSGALARATEADARRWETAARARGHADARGVYGSSYGVYRATRPLLMPAGLCGAHSIRIYAATSDLVRGPLCHATLYYGDGTKSDPFSRGRASASPR